MEELIQIAFSAINMRLEECEKELLRITDRVENIVENCKKIEKQVEEMSFQIDSTNKNLTDEVEEYKFGI